jgi:hypothetical protein
VAACAVIGALAAAGPAMAADGGCQLSGTANFTSPLGTTAHDFGYSFTGTLTNCKSTDASWPASGTIESNVPITSGGVTYQPDATDTGTGSCSSSTTAGTAVVRWVDGTVSVIKYTTTGYTAAVALTGSVVPSATYTGPADPLTGIKPVLTVTTTRALAASSGGALAFEANPADCAANAVSSAGLAGAVGLHA